MSYADVLAGGAEVGETVAVVGSGGIGFDVAEFLTHTHDDASPSVNIDSFLQQWGVDGKNATRGGLLEKPEWASQRKVQLLQRKHTKHGAALGKTTGWIHRAGLNNMNVEMIGGVKYEKVDEDGNLHVEITTRVKKKKGEKGGKKGKKGEVEVTKEKRILVNDNIVVCAGQESLLELETPLAAAGVSCFRIGGAQYAGELDANRAIDQATRLALKVRRERGREGREREERGRGGTDG